MLNCKISKKNNPRCATKVSGIKKLWIANWDEGHKFTSSDSGCTIDTIELAGSEKFIPLAVEEGTTYANATATQGSSRDSKYVMHTVGGMLPEIDCDLLSDFNNYILASVIIVALTKSGKVYIYGADNGLTAASFDFQTGTAEGDANGIAFVYDGAQLNPPLQVSDIDVIKDLEMA